MSKKQSARRSAKNAPAAGRTAPRFSDEEREAMQERAKELKRESRRSAGAAADGERDVMAKIAAMSPADRTLAEQLHALIKATAPSLAPRTWYGMPAYARHGKVVVFFQGADKFKSRYATLGFSDEASLDAGAMWPTSYALTRLTAVEKEQIAALVRRAVGESGRRSGA